MTHAEPVEAIPQPRPTVEATTRAGQPYEYRRRPLVEPDWTRFPGWTHVTRDMWESAQWQRVHCVKNIKARPGHAVGSGIVEQHRHGESAPLWRR